MFFFYALGRERNIPTEGGHGRATSRGASLYSILIVNPYEKPYVEAGVSMGDTNAEEIEA